MTASSPLAKRSKAPFSRAQHHRSRARRVHTHKRELWRAIGSSHELEDGRTRCSSSLMTQERPRRIDSSTKRYMAYFGDDKVN